MIDIRNLCVRYGDFEALHSLNLEIKKGEHAPPDFDFQPRDHVELAEQLDLIDFEGGARVAGAGPVGVDLVVGSADKQRALALAGDFIKRDATHHAHRGDQQQVVPSRLNIGAAPEM